MKRRRKKEKAEREIWITEGKKDIKQKYLDR